MLKKFVHKFAPLIVLIIVLLTGWILLNPFITAIWEFLKPSRDTGSEIVAIAETSNESSGVQGFVNLGCTIDSIHKHAEVFRDDVYRWPSQLKDMKRFGGFHDENWRLTLQFKEDTFVVTAKVHSKTFGFLKGLTGAYMTVDNFGNKCYSHENLKRECNKGYLKEAKKVKSK